MPSPVPAPLRDASPTRRGLMGITAQTFAGVKTFLDAIKLAIKTSATLPAGGVELEGSMVYNSTTKKAQVHNGTAWQSVVTDVSADAVAVSYGGGEAWADATPNPATSVEGQLDKIITDLSGTAGADKLGATAGGIRVTTTIQGQLEELDAKKLTMLTAGAVWTEFPVNITEGWSIPFPSDAPRCLIRGDKVLFAGTVKRVAANVAAQIPFTVPDGFRVARGRQGKVLWCRVPTLTPQYVGLILAGGTMGDPNMYIWNEPIGGYANLEVYLDGLEAYLY